MSDERTFTLRQRSTRPAVAFTRWRGEIEVLKAQIALIPDRAYVSRLALLYGASSMGADRARRAVARRMTCTAGGALSKRAEALF
jgi:hypothetical protein